MCITESGTQRRHKLLNAKDFSLLHKIYFLSGKTIKSIYETAGVFNNFFYKREGYAKIILVFTPEYAGLKTSQKA